MMTKLATTPPTVSLNSNLKNCTIFQWNARGLRSKLADFHQLVQTYQFPFIVISESRVGDHFRLKNYYFLHSHRLTGVSRLLIGLRKDIQAAAVPVPPHDNEEYVCANTVIGTQRFTFIGAYLEPGSTFDVSRLEKILDSTSPPHIVCGDFNAHNEILGKRTYQSSRSKACRTAHKTWY